ncbi:M20/M25/M40 family metallo-hydrolase [Zavarzinia sp. CC-PAN008]|uniref:M20/M25/M40 family metallo-hydrolase n=1 Tax=Zavarzinia sp. CC-PAN008 TaxID=3243332 RepID=UPI003F747F8C
MNGTPAPRRAADSVRESVLGWIEQDRDRLIGFFSRFLQARSDNPPGDTVAAAAVVAQALEAEDLGFDWINARDDMPNLAASFDGATPGSHLVLNGHIDVFPVEDGATPWTHGPWSGAIADGRIWGRGAVDMKCGTTASIFTYIYLHRLRQHLKGRLSLTVVSDEETFGPYGARYMLKVRPDLYGDACLSGEPSGAGILRFGERGRMWLRFTVCTPGAHGAYPHLSASASRIGARLMLDLDRLADLDTPAPPEVADVLEQAVPIVEATMGEGAATVMRRITVTVGTVKAGVKVNMVPSTCVFEVDIRLPIGVGRERIRAAIDAIMANYPEATYEEFGFSDANWSNPAHPLGRAIAEAARGLQQATPVPAVGLGATDMQLWRGAGVPAFVYGPPPTLMGKRDENVTIAEFLHVVRSHALAALDYLS